MLNMSLIFIENIPILETLNAKRLTPNINMTNIHLKCNRTIPMNHLAHKLSKPFIFLNKSTA